MKPNLTTSENSNSPLAKTRRDNARSLAMKTDCQYTTARLAGYRGQPAKRAAELRSFRLLSENYFAQEEPQSFVAEASVFALIALAAAWPIVLSVQALAHLAGMTPLL